MQEAHGMSQTGGYHHFLSHSARQLQRFVRQRPSSGASREAQRARMGQRIPLRCGAGAGAFATALLAGLTRSAATKRLARDR